MLRDQIKASSLREQMRRRQFIMLVGGAAASLPAMARAQERMRRIAGFAKELVALQPDLVLAITTPAVAAILRETHSIPVVFTVVSDPVGSGFVPPNLSRPGGNVTGFSNFEASLGGKWVQVLKDIAAQISRVALLFNPATAPYINNYWGALEAASKAFGAAAQAAPYHGAADIEATIKDLARRSDAGLIVMPDISDQTHRETIISLAALHRVPTIYGFKIFVQHGGLVSYGSDLPDLHRRAATYADLILKGARPAELPVQLPTKFELAINLKTARALGLDIPPALLARADEVIE
jgi:putative ABC transport system substrate-binding protein